jgi:hypothetical protein
VRPTLCRLGLGLTVVACQPNTTRPPITPFPEAAGTEIRLSPLEATRRMAEALRADSLPVRTVALRDAYIETPWFNAATRRPILGRPLGPNVVRIRAWADPARPGSSLLTVETVYRPLADPSLPERELEREVARNHPVAVKMEAALRRLVERYGGPPPPQAETPAGANEGVDGQ